MDTGDQNLSCAKLKISNNFFAYWISHVRRIFPEEG